MSEPAVNTSTKLPVFIFTCCVASWEFSKMTPIKVVQESVAEGLSLSESGKLVL